MTTVPDEEQGEAADEKGAQRRRTLPVEPRILTLVERASLRQEMSESIEQMRARRRDTEAQDQPVSAREQDGEGNVTATDTNAPVQSGHRFEVTLWLYGDGGWRLRLFVGEIGVTGGHFPTGDEGYREATKKGRLWVTARDAVPSIPTSFGEPYGVECDTRFLENDPDDYVMVGSFPRRDPHDPETRKRRCRFELDAGDGMRLRVQRPARAPVEARVIEMPTGNTYRVSIVGFENEEHFEGQAYDVRVGEEVVVGGSQMWAMWGAPAER